MCARALEGGTERERAIWMEVRKVPKRQKTALTCLCVRLCMCVCGVFVCVCVCVSTEESGEGRLSSLDDLAEGDGSGGECEDREAVRSWCTPTRL